MRPEAARALADQVVARELHAIARAITVLEHDQAGPDILHAELFALAPGQAHVVGLTGPPGVGKSVLVDRLVTELRERDRRVAVLAVDPSSPFTGGALLGDRVRMRPRPDDDGVFWRSLGSRGEFGGLAPVFPDAVRVLDAAAFDVILVETVGVGQTELEVLRRADCGIVVCVPGAGDGVQLMKAGLLETGDLYAVNKADTDGAAAGRLMRELRATLRRDEAGTGTPEVLAVSALEGKGIDELVDAVERFVARSTEVGALAERRREALEREVFALVERHAVSRARSASATLRQLIEEVALRARDPRSAAEELLRLTSSGSRSGRDPQSGRRAAPG